MTDLRQGVSEMAHRALDELEMLMTDSDPAREIGRAMAELDRALDTQSRSLAAGFCAIAAARIIRAAELFNSQTPPAAAGGAGSDAAAPPAAAPSPPAANPLQEGAWA